MDLKLVKNQKIKDFGSGNFILNGDCKDVLNNLPKESINCVITSPPYFNQRNYGGSEHVEIGNEKTPEEYIEHLLEVFDSIIPILKPDGSLWLNLGDKYINGELAGIPWQMVFAIMG